jgi:hypothetical protein
MANVLKALSLLMVPIALVGLLPEEDVTPTSWQTPFLSFGPQGFETIDPDDDASSWTEEYAQGLGAYWFHEFLYEILAPRTIVSQPELDLPFEDAIEWKLLTHGTPAHSHSARLEGYVTTFECAVEIVGAQNQSHLMTSAAGRLIRTLEGVETTVWAGEIEAYAGFEFGSEDSDSEDEYSYDNVFPFAVDAGMCLEFYNIHLEHGIGDPDVFTGRIALQAVGDIRVTLIP